ncbi:MAG: porin, partial [Nitrospinales bacterium]
MQKQISGKILLSAAMAFLTLALALPVESEMSESELRFRALEEKWSDRIGQLEKKYKALSQKEDRKKVKKAYDSRGVKKQEYIKSGYGKSGFYLKTTDGLFATNLQWRAQMRFSTPRGGDPITSSDFRKDETNNFELRRVRMKIGGYGYKPWIKYYFEVDLQPSRNSGDSSTKSSSRVIDWRITLQPTSAIGLRVGQWKINFNRERVDSSGRQQFVERSSVNRVFTVDRQIGAMLQGRLFKGSHADMRYYAGVFNGEGRSVNNDDSSMMWLGRLQWNFLGRDLKWRQSDVSYHEKPAGNLAFAATTTRGKCTRWSS